MRPCTVAISGATQEAMLRCTMSAGGASFDPGEDAGICDHALHGPGKGSTGVSHESWAESGFN